MWLDEVNDWIYRYLHKASERMVAELKQAGCKDVELTIYPEAGHDSWTESYNNPKLYDWFLQHQRK